MKWSVLSNININNFDFLRIVFATTVAIAHFIELSQFEVIQPLKKLFNTPLAISGFFVISGFLVAKSFENSSNTKDYFFRRIKRIFPAYFFVIFLCAFFLFIISKATISEYFFNPQFYRYLVANLTFQNYFEPCLPGVFESQKICVVNGALWTIKIEEAFYISLPILYWIFRRFKINFYILLTALYLLSIIYFNYFLFQDNYRVAKQLPGAYAFFAVGILFYKKFDFFFKWKHYIILPALFLFAIEQYVFSLQFLKPISYGFMVYYLAYTLRIFNNFGKYGDFTYGIYIFHFPVIQVFVALGLFMMYSPLLMFVCTTILVLFLAVLSWVFIELPFLQPSRRNRHKQIFKSSFKYSK